MQLKLLFCLPFLLAACSSSNKTNCPSKKAFSLGQVHGQSGSSHQGEHYARICKSKPAFKQNYSQGFKLGLQSFCSEKLASEQAKSGLSQSKVCLSDAAYTQAYEKNLTDFCTKEKAISDAKKLINTNSRPCLSLSTYKKQYEKQLRYVCTYKKGFDIGKSKKTILNLCLDSPTLNQFKRGHASGLSKFFKAENRSLAKEISTLRKKRNTLKVKVRTSKNNQEAMLKLNVTESKILELRQKIEANKKYIKN